MSASVPHDMKEALMSVPTVESAARPMCSLIARATGEEPIGSISGYSRYLIAEIPLPWAADILDSPRFHVDARAALERHAQGGDVRFQGVVPDTSYSRVGYTRVMDMQRPAQGGLGFAASAYLVPTESLGQLVEALLDPLADRALPERYQVESAGRDLLVCTHGARDACCASFGFPSYALLRHELAARAPEPIRVWRTSHLGGHRFAPTMIDFPEGRAWGHLDDEALRRIVLRDGALPDLRRHYRGWTALAGLPEMLVEREILAREGWDWTRNLVSAQTRDEGDQHAVRLTFESPGGASGAYEATVEPTGEVVIGRGSCSKDAPHETRVHRVVDLTRVAAATLVGSAGAL